MISNKRDFEIRPRKGETTQEEDSGSKEQKVWGKMLRILRLRSRTKRKDF